MLLLLYTNINKELLLARYLSFWANWTSNWHWIPSTYTLNWIYVFPFSVCCLERGGGRGVCYAHWLKKLCVHWLVWDTKKDDNFTHSWHGMIRSFFSGSTNRLDTYWLVDFLFCSFILATFAIISLTFVFLCMYGTFDIYFVSTYECNICLNLCYTNKSIKFIEFPRICSHNQHTYLFLLCFFSL